MNDSIKKLEERLAKAVAESREVIDKAEAENRDFNQEEDNRYKALGADVIAIKTRLERERDQVALESRMREPMPTSAAKDGPVERTAGAGATAHINPVYQRGRAFLEKRGFIPEAEQVAAPRRDAWNRYLRGGLGLLNDAERRDLQMDADTQGGFLVPPQEFSAALIQAVDDSVFIRQWATVETVINAESLGIASLDADPADPDWTSEIGTGGVDANMKFGKRELKPHPLAKSIKLSNKLIRAAKLSVEAKVIERFTYKFGIACEKGYLLGSGAEQPLGVFVASTDGISTARDVTGGAGGNTATAIAADGLLSAKFKLKGNYWPRAKWLFHRDALLAIMKLKDTNGQYLWVTAGVGQRGLQDGMTDTLVGAPVSLSEYVPNTFTTGKYVGIIGDFSKYGIVDALTLNFQRLIELYAATNQIGYIGRLETDGMPLLEEAFARVTLG